jgi:hypothetical protein
MPRNFDSFVKRLFEAWFAEAVRCGHLPSDKNPSDAGFVLGFIYMTTQGEI